MKKFKLSIVALFTAILAFACGQTKTADNSAQFSTNQNGTTATYNAASSNSGGATDELASAKVIYSEKCVKCHKEDGKGGVTDFDGTKIKAPDFTSGKHHETDADYVEIIENGAKDDGMPAFKGKISDDDIKNLVKYIRRDFQGK